MKRPTQVILTMLGALASWFAKGLLGLAFMVFFAVMMLEWMAGCGETYIDAKGERHAHECMFIGKPAKEWFK